jgi:hypothetical protein
LDEMFSGSSLIVAAIMKRLTEVLWNASVLWPNAIAIYWGRGMEKTSMYSNYYKLSFNCSPKHSWLTAFLLFLDRKQNFENLIKKAKSPGSPN